MASEIELGPEEVVAGKPFSDPARTRGYQEALRHLLRHERERAKAWEDDSESRTGVVIREIDPEGHRHLLVVPDTRALLDAASPTVVGFFGKPKADADLPLLFDLEEELVETMTDHIGDGLLSYYDVELVKGKYGNLILFATPEGPTRWRENAVHRRAVDISPGQLPRDQAPSGQALGSAPRGRRAQRHPDAVPRLRRARRLARASQVSGARRRRIGGRGGPGRRASPHDLPAGLLRRVRDPRGQARRRDPTRAR